MVWKKYRRETNQISRKIHVVSKGLWEKWYQGIYEKWPEIRRQRDETWKNSRVCARERQKNEHCEKSAKKGFIWTVEHCFWQINLHATHTWAQVRTNRACPLSNFSSLKHINRLITIRNVCLYVCRPMGGRSQERHKKMVAKRKNNNGYKECTIFFFVRR